MVVWPAENVFFIFLNFVFCLFQCACHLIWMNSFIWFFVSANVVIFNFGMSKSSIAFMASWSAFSLPSMLLCPGTLISVMFIPELFNSYIFCCIRFAKSVLLSSVLSESVRIVLFLWMFPWLYMCSIVLRIAMASAVYTLF